MIGYFIGSNYVNQWNNQS